MDSAFHGSCGPSPSEAEASLRSRFKTALILRFSWLAAIFVLIVPAWAVSQGRAGGPTGADDFGVITVTFEVMAVLWALAAVFGVPLIVPLRGASLERIPGLLFTRAIISGALAEAIGILGFVLFVLTNSLAVYAAFTVGCVVTSLLCWPLWSGWTSGLFEAATPSVP